MTKHLDKNDILQLANQAFPDSFVTKQAVDVDKIDFPLELLARYVVASVEDLYGNSCQSNANLERIALSLDTGAQALHQIALQLRREKGP